MTAKGVVDDVGFCVFMAVAGVVLAAVLPVLAVFLLLAWVLRGAAWLVIR